MRFKLKITMSVACSAVLFFSSLNGFAEGTHVEPRSTPKCTSVGERIGSTALLPLGLVTEIVMRGLFLFVDPHGSLTDFETGPIADWYVCVIGREIYVSVPNDPGIIKRISEDLGRPFETLTEADARSYGINEWDRREFNANLDKINRIKEEIVDGYTFGDEKLTFVAQWENKLVEENVPPKVRAMLVEIVKRRTQDILDGYGRWYDF